MITLAKQGGYSKRHVLVCIEAQVSVLALR